MPVTTVDRTLLPELRTREERRFVETHPRSLELLERARRSLLAGVPMPWMTRVGGPFPRLRRRGRRAPASPTSTGTSYVDFCLGDTGRDDRPRADGAVEAIAAQAARGITLDAADRGLDLGGRGDGAALRAPATGSSRSPPPTPTASRSGSRAQLTGRPKILVLQLVLPRHRRRDVRDDRRRGRHRRRGPATSGRRSTRRVTTRVVEFNDLEALERALAHGDVACVLAEPALTNIGIVLPDPGYHEALRELTPSTARSSSIDETHTLCAGPGGCTRAHGPASPTSSRSASRSAAACPSARYGMTRGGGATRIAAAWRRRRRRRRRRSAARSRATRSRCAAMRATLEHVLTDEAFERMIPLAERCDRRRRGRDRRHALALARQPARLPRRVPVHARAAAQRRRGRRRRRSRARPLPAPVRAEPRRPAHAVPQHGADVPGHDGRRRRPPHRGLRRGGRRADGDDVEHRAPGPRPTIGARPRRCGVDG